MERIKTIETRDLCASAKNGGCGECQTSCQSACKTSCGVANQQCENAKKADREREPVFFHLCGSLPIGQNGRGLLQSGNGHDRSLQKIA